MANVHDLQDMSPRTKTLEEAAAASAALTRTTSSIEAGGNSAQKRLRPDTDILSLRSAGGNSSQVPVSPEKERLRAEIESLKDKTELIEEKAISQVARTRDDLTERARAALKSQTDEFNKTAMEFKFEAREINKVEIAQTLAGERGRLQSALQDASTRLKNESGEVLSLQSQNLRTQREAAKVVQQTQAQASWEVLEKTRLAEEKVLRTEELAERLLQQRTGTIHTEAESAVQVERDQMGAQLNSVQVNLMTEISNLSHTLRQKDEEILMLAQAGGNSSQPSLRERDLEHVSR